MIYINLDWLFIIVYRYLYNFFIFFNSVEISIIKKEIENKNKDNILFLLRLLNVWRSFKYLYIFFEVLSI